ncbi:hypothetical protein [Hansschlegelia zhihuaiae]|uniref:Uncharacterized protein n=1 Tax=Hansschlegelia zhihuaiae TaxID=405005 RepID=A0A4Q0M3G2_9HYPH|nr:hypothetical protein EK403_21630 [Hansschlegelia zhihuaiae]
MACGGDRHSGRVEAQAALILALLDEKDDITLAELQARLAEHGHGFGLGTLWWFFAARDHLEKDRARRGAGAARRPEAAAGLVRGPARARSRAARLLDET